MLALLLATAVQMTLPSTPTALVTFLGGESVTVIGPANSANHPEFPWRLAQTLLSPKGNAAAIRFCSEPAGFRFCETELTRPGQPVLTLKNSGVTRLLWSADGHFLTGAGANTVRLWNLSGGVRTALPTPPLIDPGVTQSSTAITRLWLNRGNLCVAAQDQLFDVRGQQKGQTVTTTRYALPTLKRLTTTTFPATPKQTEAHCMPVRASS